MRSAPVSKYPEASTFNNEPDAIIEDDDSDEDVEVLNCLPIGAIFIESEIDSDDLVYGVLPDTNLLFDDPDSDKDIGQQEGSNRSPPDLDSWKNALIAEVLFG